MLEQNKSETLIPWDDGSIVRLVSCAVGAWTNQQNLSPKEFACGNCGRHVASDKGYANGNGYAQAYICPNCDHLTTFYMGGLIVPGGRVGPNVEHLPEIVDGVYSEARTAAQAGANTGCVLLCRKLLMHIAVEKQAEVGFKFVQYVDYLDTKGYVPPDGKHWVSHIKNMGNKGTHELVQFGHDEATEILAFTGMLLVFVYEFPAKLPKP